MILPYLHTTAQNSFLWFDFVWNLPQIFNVNLTASENVNKNKSQKQVLSDFLELLGGFQASLVP